MARQQVSLRTSPAPRGLRWQPQSNDRYFLVGPTRCGKTEREKVMAGWFEQTPGLLTLYLDPKLAGGLAHIPAIDLADVPHAEGVWRMPLAPVDFCAEPVCEAVFRRGDVLVVIDELPLIATESKVGKWLRAVYQQGAERGIGVMATTQDPVGVPRICRTQAEHYLIWRLRADDYVELMAKAAHVDPRLVMQRMGELDDYECLLCSDRLPPEMLPYRLPATL